MAQYQITVDEESVQGLLTGGDGMAQLVQQVIQQILEAQVVEQLSADRYERTDDRQGYRNGYKPRKLVTRVGQLTLRVPQIRDGVFSTELFARYQRNEQALVLALMEMVINGVSTRKVAQITEELCGTEFSKSTVSALCAKLDPLVTAWNERPLSDHRYPFLIVDALIIRVRENSRIYSISGLVAVGINDEGFREILGLRLGDSESEETWSGFFVWLKSRGLKDVALVVSDNHGGLVHAVRKNFQGAAWQRCQTHLTKNVLDAAPKSVRQEIHGYLRSIFEAPTVEAAGTLLDQTLKHYQGRATRAMQRLEAGFDDATAVMVLPEPYRKRLRTTNGLERLNEEIRRRERVIRIFPNRASAVRLLGALLMEVDERWSTGRRYFNMEAYEEWRKTAPSSSHMHSNVTVL